MFKLKKSSFTHKYKIYSELTKSNLSIMNSTVVIFGYIVANPVISIPTILTLGIGNLGIAFASQIKGQVLEIDFDSKMDRTKTRPLPLKEITESKANIIHYCLLAGSNLMLFAGGIPYGSILLSNLTYTSYLVYLKTKEISKFNTILGSIPGSLPFLIGVAAGGNLSLIDPICVFAVSYLFLWNILHFYSIYINFFNDYKKTDYKNLSLKGYSVLMFLAVIVQMGLFAWFMKDKDLGSNMLYYLIATGFILQHLKFTNNILQYMKTSDIKYGPILRKSSYTMLLSTFSIIYITKFLHDKNLKKNENMK